MKPAWELVASALLAAASCAVGQAAAQSPSGGSAPRDLSENASAVRELAVREPAVRELAVRANEKVVAFDDRSPVFDTTEQPYAGIGLIEIRIPNYRFDDGVVAAALVRGTGTLVGPRTVLTAAHVIEPLLEYSGEAAFSPARDGTNKPFGSLRVVDWVMEPGFMPNRNREHDLALLTLETAVDELTPLPIYAASDSFYEDGVVMAAGYPGDLSANRMYEAFGSFLGLVGGRLAIHGVDTYFGESGAPMLAHRPRDGAMSLVAIHTAGATEDSQQFNWAIRMTRARVRWIEKYSAAEPDLPNPYTEDQGNSVLGAESTETSGGACGTGVGMSLPLMLAGFAGASAARRSSRVRTRATRSPRV